jgi:hypothetical protein
MRRPLGLNLIIKYYSFIGGLTLALSFFQLMSINNNVMKQIFIDPCLDFIAHNTIFTTEFLKSLPESIMLVFAFLFTFIISLFHTLLANAFYLNNGKAFLFGILFHSYSAFSSFALWMFGVKALKLIGVFFLFMNLIKATYLYIKRVNGEVPK